MGRMGDEEVGLRRKSEGDMLPKRATPAAAAEIVIRRGKSA